MSSITVYPDYSKEIKNAVIQVYLDSAQAGSVSHELTLQIQSSPFPIRGCTVFYSGAVAQHGQSGILGPNQDHRGRKTEREKKT